MNELKIGEIIPGNFSVLLFLAVNDRSDWIPLDADSKSMPLAIGQTRAKFDNLPFASLDALANSWDKNFENLWKRTYIPSVKIYEILQGNFTW